MTRMLAPSRPPPSSSFFSQAEDGIRAGRVTGVPTCALPISTTTTGWSTRRGPPRAPTNAPRRSRPSPQRPRPRAAEDRKSVGEGKRVDGGSWAIRERKGKDAAAGRRHREGRRGEKRHENRQG